jgi:hypothetical protein
MTMLEEMTDSAELVSSIVCAVAVLGVIYGVYFLATYFGSKRIIRQD